MKVNKYISSVALSLGALALTATSCSDFLDKEPDERVDLITEGQINDFLNAAYPAYNYGPLCELSSDNMVDNNAPHYDETSKKTIYYNLNSYDRRDDEIFKFEAVKSSEDMDSPSGLWQGYYQSIAAANQALVDIDKIVAKSGWTEALRASRAEALLLRAYDHFMLVNIFSQAYKNDEASKQDVGIPYVTVPEDKVFVEYDRSNVADTYAKIQADLEEGLKDVSDINYGKPKWRFNTKAAHAFAARFYLYKRDYNKVIDHANAVLGTDRSLLPSMLMKYDSFDKAVYTYDYARKWQGPDLSNNLMLVATNSTAMRHMMGGVRYSCNSTAADQIIMRGGPTWTWTIMPCAMIAGLFVNGSSDYGLWQAKIAEEFEYSDKTSGIGYCHIIRREFTCTQLLLDRAEALLLSSDRRDVNAAVQDLIAYENSRQSFNEQDMTFYSKNGRSMWPLTEDIIKEYYTYNDRKREQNPGVYQNWNFTQNMSADFVVPADIVPYFNCLNDFRRYETVFEGNRFFDLKRYGIEYSHIYGKNEEKFTLTWNDPRRAIEIPQKALSVGLPTSRPAGNVTEVPSTMMIDNNDK